MVKVASLLMAAILYIGSAMAVDYTRSDVVSGHPDSHSEPASRGPMRKPSMIQFPIQSQTMRPGRFESYSITNSRPIPRPLCFVGTDNYSVAWLREHAHAIRGAGAICMIVQAHGLVDLKRLADLGTGIHMIPATADEYAEMFDVQYYPAIVSNGRVEQ